MSDDPRGEPLVRSGASEALIDELAGAHAHLLALVLHEDHGWRLRALGVPADRFSLRPWRGLSGPRHIYCLLPDGRPVDAHGIHAGERALRRFWAHQDAPGERLASAAIDAVAVHTELPRLGYRQVHEDELEAVRARARSLELAGLAAAHPRPRRPPARAGSLREHWSADRRRARG